MDFKRYAVYFTPSPGPLAEFGTRWLGWDIAAGKAVQHPDIAGLPLPVSDITRTPRRYGLHATIKPPFRLTDGQDKATLRSAFDVFCQGASPVTVTGLELAQLGRFLALVPAGDDSTLNALAAQAVRALDTFRAPPGEAELAKRRAGGLNRAQDRLLTQWGYPYVMEAFRFHITLSGKLPNSQARQVAEALRPTLEPLIPAPYLIDVLSLVGEDEAGMFHLIHRQTLSG